MKKTTFPYTKASELWAKKSLDHQFMGAISFFMKSISHKKQRVYLEGHPSDPSPMFFVENVHRNWESPRGLGDS